MAHPTVTPFPQSDAPRLEGLTVFVRGLRIVVRTALSGPTLTGAAVAAAGATH